MEGGSWLLNNPADLFVVVLAGEPKSLHPCAAHVEDQVLTAAVGAHASNTVTT